MTPGPLRCESRGPVGMRRGAWWWAVSRHGAPEWELSPLLLSAIDRSSVLSELGFKIKLHPVLTVAVTSFVTFELFVSKMHNLGLGGGLHFGRLLSTHFLEAQGL